MKTQICPRLSILTRRPSLSELLALGLVPDYRLRRLPICRILRIRQIQAEDSLVSSQQLATEMMRVKAESGRLVGRHQAAASPVLGLALRIRERAAPGKAQRRQAETTGNEWPERYRLVYT
jgi:hypothetical protein